MASQSGTYVPFKVRDIALVNYENKVYILPEHLDEKVAFLHLAHIGAKLETLEKEQAEYIGFTQAGSYKPEHCRYWDLNNA